MYAVVLFGSQVSGGCDGRSDQDLLVVCESQDKSKYIKKYSDKGYSVSAYTKKQLYLMKRHGSLFLQHLKIESTILHDKDNLFGDFIGTCELTPPQDQEMIRCMNSLINTMRCPDVGRLSWWLADYLFVLSRDYFVKYFARAGQLVFNVNKLCCEIKREFNLTQEEASVFLDLRRYKAIYRDEGPKSYSVIRTINRWNTILSKILDCSVPCRQDIDTYINFRKVNAFQSTYELLRYVESIKVVHPHISCGSVNEYIVKKMITRPNHYSSTSVRGKEFLVNYLLGFRAKANMCVNADFKKSRSFLTPLFEAGYA